MHYQLQVKPAVLKDGMKYKVIEVTDVTLHARAMRPTQNIAKKIKEAMEKQEPGRIYAPIVLPNDAESREFAITLIQNDPEFIKMVQEEEQKGFKVLISLPKGGIPLLLGDDAKEKLKQLEGKGRTALIHRNRKNVWRAKDKEV